MAIAELTPLENFHQFVSQQMQSEECRSMSPEQALALWRERQDTVAAVREGLADIDAGRMRSLEDFDREFRLRHGLPEVA